MSFKDELQNSILCIHQTHRNVRSCFFLLNTKLKIITLSVMGSQVFESSINFLCPWDHIEGVCRIIALQFLSELFITFYAHVPHLHTVTVTTVTTGSLKTWWMNAAGCAVWMPCKKPVTVHIENEVCWWAHWEGRLQCMILAMILQGGMSCRRETPHLCSLQPVLWVQERNQTLPIPVYL